MTICPHCHSVLPSQPVLDWENTKGYEHLKRAIEVSLAGGHSLTVIGNSQCENLASIVQAAINLGASIQLLPPCPCGNWGSYRRDCTCSTETVTEYRSSPAWNTALQADLFVDAGELDSRKLLDQRKGEALESVLARVNRAKLNSQTSDKLDEAASGLLRSALGQFPSLGDTLSRVLRVAHTIAKLSSTSRTCVQAADLAEAIQYRPRF